MTKQNFAPMFMTVQEKRWLCMCAGFRVSRCFLQQLCHRPCSSADRAAALHPVWPECHTQSHVWGQEGLLFAHCTWLHEEASRRFSPSLSLNWQHMYAGAIRPNSKATVWLIQTVSLKYIIGYWSCCHLAAVSLMVSAKVSFPLNLYYFCCWDTCIKELRSADPLCADQKSSCKLILAEQTLGQDSHDERPLAASGLSMSRTCVCQQKRCSERKQAVFWFKVSDSKP